MTLAYLGLGSNIGDCRQNLRLALRWLEGAGQVMAVSSLYRSRAVVLEGESPGPDYLNAACAIDTQLRPVELLEAVKAIEYAIGRRPAPKWAPRPIDIDILLYGEQVVTTPDLQVPHPLLAGRGFALLPLAEIAPDALHPVLGRAVAEIVVDAEFEGLEHVEEPGWESRHRPLDEPPGGDADDGPDGALT